jgi:apolipoprotein N-acyltransferase
MGKMKSLLLAILSGVLMGLSWPETGSLTPLLFIGLVPLLYLEHQHSKKQGSNWKLLMLAYVAFLLFNTITTWWILFASLPGMLMAEVLNSLFMALVFMLFHWTKKKMGSRAGYAALVMYWLGFEWVHYNWELSWVWLTFGNVFALRPTWIQWYEYTGVFGGSLWVLLVNILVFKLLLQGLERGKRQLSWVLGSVLGILLILPISVSYGIYNSYEEKKDPVEVVVVQPNIDPYYEKFYGMAESDQVDLLTTLAKSQLSTATGFVVFPETAFPMGYWEHELEYIYGVEQMRELLNEFPKLRIVTGLSTKKLYAPSEERSATARTYNDGTGNYYDFYNTAMQLDRSTDLQLYHKSKLVLGVEKMPFGEWLKPLEDLSINLGGASGSLGHELEAHNFTGKPGSSAEHTIAPVICYESIYGEYLSEYIRKGATLIFIITNDGWWQDTPGYRQHLAYASLRAIETRRCIARSANTGISAFIDQKGEISQPTKWWTRVAIKASINANDQLTFYVKNGDYIGRVAAFFALLLLVWFAARRLQKKAV